MRNVLKPLGLAVALALSTVGAAQANPYEAPGDGEPRPQMLTLRYEFGSGQPRQWLANGVRLTPAAPTPLRAREQDSGSSAAAIILAIGVGIALVVLVAGDAAEDITDDKDESGSSGDCLPGMPGC